MLFSCGMNWQGKVVVFVEGEDVTQKESIIGGPHEH